MPSFDELADRAKKEAANLHLYLFPPSTSLDEEPAPLAGLPDPAPVVARLRGTGYAAEVERLADSVVAHRFPLLGYEIKTGSEIDWNRDYVNEKRSDLTYFRRFPDLNFDRVGERRIVWELNRHQHLVLLAQAALLTSRDDYRAEIQAQLESWVSSNPLQRGINWMSPFEVGMRTLSWIWVFHLVGAKWDAEFRKRFLNWLYQHGSHLEHNCTTAGQTNTEQLGAGLGLFAIGRLFPKGRSSREWRRMGTRIVRRELDRVLADGAWCEQSSYFHLQALDLLLFFYLIANRPKAFRAKLERMAEYLQVLQGPARRLPLIGDDDGGRVFHPFGQRHEFGRATLATCSVAFQRKDLGATAADAAIQAAWWLGEYALDCQIEGSAHATDSCLFQVSGLAVMGWRDRQVLIDAASFGASRGRHSHADTLSVLVRTGDEEVLVDPGTYQFVSDPAARNWFRGTSAHNTVRVDGLDQATALPDFGWKSRPLVQVVSWTEDPESTSLEATCHYRGVSHRRRIRFRRPDYLFIVDFIEGRAGFHYAEQFWHPGDKSEWRILIPQGVRVHREEGWRSRVFGTREPATVLRIRMEGDLPFVMPALIMLGDRPELPLELRETQPRIYALFEGGEQLAEFRV